MDSLQRRALLGDARAQEECTQQGIMLSCPHCKGNAKVSFKDSRFVGENIRGDKKLVYRVQVICNKCRSRGKPVFTEPLINPNPYITKWGNCYHAESDVCKSETERFLPYVMAAISEWNTRLELPINLLDATTTLRTIAARADTCTPDTAAELLRVADMLDGKEDSDNG